MKRNTINLAPTLYPELNQVLLILVESILKILNDNFVGMYLQGSLATGDFDMYSDVDFIVVTEEELSDDQVDALQQMHPRIYHLDSEWAKHLEGSYFPKEILRDHSHKGEDLWYLDHGSQKLIRSEHCNTIVVRWLVREKGVAMLGPPPESLIDPISSDLLRSDIYEVINEWGQEILEDPDRFNNRFYQGFIVLSYCRMLHDLYKGVNASKQVGAEWAKENLDPSWSDLIDRAWDCRPDPAKSVRERPNPDDFDRTLEFVQYIIDESKLFYHAYLDA